MCVCVSVSWLAAHYIKPINRSIAIFIHNFIYIHINIWQSIRNKKRKKEKRSGSIEKASTLKKCKRKNILKFILKNYGVKCLPMYGMCFKRYGCNIFRLCSITPFFMIFHSSSFIMHQLVFFLSVCVHFSLLFTSFFFCLLPNSILTPNNEVRHRMLFIFMC